MEMVEACWGVRCVDWLWGQGFSWGEVCWLGRAVRVLRLGELLTQMRPQRFEESCCSTFDLAVISHFLHPFCQMTFDFASERTKLSRRFMCF